MKKEPEIKIKERPCGGYLLARKKRLLRGDATQEEVKEKWDELIQKNSGKEAFFICNKRWNRGEKSRREWGPALSGEKKGV